MPIWLLMALLEGVGWGAYGLRRAGGPSWLGDVAALSPTNQFAQARGWVPQSGHATSEGVHQLLGGLGPMVALGGRGLIPSLKGKAAAGLAGKAAPWAWAMSPMLAGGGGEQPEAAGEAAAGTPGSPPAGAPATGGYSGSTGPMSNEMLIALLQGEREQKSREFQDRLGYATRVGNPSQWQLPGQQVMGMIAPALQGLLARTYSGGYTGHERDILPGQERGRPATSPPLDEPGAMEALLASLVPSGPLPERRITVGPYSPPGEGYIVRSGKRRRQPGD